MGTRYGHLTLEERCQIAPLQAAGRAIRQIAATLERAPSPVAREGKRNRAPAGPYQPVSAAQQARARRWRGARLERNETLRTRVLAPLAPGLVAGAGGWAAGIGGGPGGPLPREHLPVPRPTVCAPEGLERFTISCSRASPLSSCRP